VNFETGQPSHVCPPLYAIISIYLLMGNNTWNHDNVQVKLETGQLSRPIDISIYLSMGNNIWSHNDVQVNLVAWTGPIFPYLQELEGYIYHINVKLLTIMYRLTVLIDMVSPQLHLVLCRMITVLEITFE